VASLASDPNVWNAVMENPAVHSFFQSQQTGNPNSYLMVVILQDKTSLKTK